ncbi:hypothetical protein [Guyparkeria sp.]
MTKGLLIGFGFLIVMSLIAVGLVRYANALPARPKQREAADTGERDGH